MIDRVNLTEATDTVELAVGRTEVDADQVLDGSVRRVPQVPRSHM